MQRKKDFSFIFERKNCKVNEFAADFVNWKQIITLALPETPAVSGRSAS